MFTRYSQTYAAALVALAGVVVTLSNAFGWNWAEVDVIHVLGLVADGVGVVWVLFHRKAKGDIGITGARK